MLPQDSNPLLFISIPTSPDSMDIFVGLKNELISFQWTTQPETIKILTYVTKVTFIDFSRCLFTKRSWYEILGGQLLSWYYLYSIEYISFSTNVKENLHFIDHGNFENWEIWVRYPQIEGQSVVLNEKFGIYTWWIIHHHYPPFNLKNVMQIVGSPHLKPNHRPFWHFGSFESSLDFELDRTKICPPKPKVLIVRVIRNA